MANAPEYHFSEPVTIFHGSRLPERATPVGYAALIDAHSLKVPMPRVLSAIGPRHKEYEQDGWHIYTPRHAPLAGLEGHLTFALKYEGLDLLVLKALFQATGPQPIEAMPGYVQHTVESLPGDVEAALKVGRTSKRRIARGSDPKCLRVLSTAFLIRLRNSWVRSPSSPRIGGILGSNCWTKEICLSSTALFWSRSRSPSTLCRLTSSICSGRGDAS